MDEIEHEKISSISSTEYVNVINLLMHWNKKIDKQQQTIMNKKIETHWEFRIFPFLWIIIPRSNWNNSMNRNQIQFIRRSTLDVENYCDSFNRCDRLVELFIWISIESHIIWIDQMNQHKGDRFN